MCCFRPCNSLIEALLTDQFTHLKADHFSYTHRISQPSQPSILEHFHPLKRNCVPLSNNLPAPLIPVQFSSVAQSCPTLCDPVDCSLPGLCPSPTPRVNSNSCAWSWQFHPTISSSVLPFSSCLQSFPASVSFQMSQLFASGGQSTGVSASASVLPMNIQD